MKHNEWHISKIFDGQYNYDDKGFDMIDIESNVIININILTNTRFSVQGIFRFRNANTIVISSGNIFTTFPYCDSERILNWEKSNEENYKKAISELCKAIKPLFQYTNSDWMHKRVFA